MSVVRSTGVALVLLAALSSQGENAAAAAPSPLSATLEATSKPDRFRERVGQALWISVAGVALAAAVAYTTARLGGARWPLAAGAESKALKLQISRRLTRSLTVTCFELDGNEYLVIESPHGVVCQRISGTS